MRFRLFPVGLVAVAAFGCSADRSTGPDEAGQVAAELELAAGHVGLAAGPTGAIAFQSAAAAIRAGVKPQEVQITVAGSTDKWRALGHEILIVLPAGAAPADFQPSPLRSLIAWQPSQNGLRVIHLLAHARTGPVGRLVTEEPGDAQTFVLPSFLLYAERRDAMWQAVTGEQTSVLESTGAACPAAASPPAGAPAPQSCVEASFTFGFSGVRAEPFVMRLGPNPPPQVASGTRTLAMSPQPVPGVHIKIMLPALPPPPIIGHGIP